MPRGIDFPKAAGPSCPSGAPTGGSTGRTHVDGASRREHPAAVQVPDLQGENPSDRVGLSEAGLPRVLTHGLSSQSAAVRPALSTSKEPCSSGPALSYRWIPTPVVDVLAPTSRKAPGTVPSPKRRLPEPTTTGKTQRRNSSMRSCFNNVWIRLELPGTWISPPACSLRRATAVAASHGSRVEFCHSTLRSVREATNLCMVFSFFATGSSGSVTRGQCAAKISYVLRPSRSASGCIICSSMILPIISSQNFTDQPPCSKPPSRSSSGPPGACITPSMVTKVPTTSFLTGLSSGHTLSILPGSRTELQRDCIVEFEVWPAIGRLGRPIAPTVKNCGILHFVAQHPIS